MIRKPAGNFVGAFVQHLCMEKDLDIAPLAIHLISPILTILTHISPICCTHPSHVCIPPIPCICAPHTLNTPIWPSSMNLEDVLDNVGKIKQDLLSRVLQSKFVYQQVRKGLFKLCSYWTEAAIINQVDSLQSCNLQSDYPVQPVQNEKDCTIMQVIVALSIWTGQWGEICFISM